MASPSKNFLRDDALLVVFPGREITVPVVISALALVKKILDTRPSIYDSLINTEPFDKLGLLGN